MMEKLDEMLRRFAATPVLKKKIKGKEIGLFLLSDREMRAMKKRFLPREKGPANVLAFPEAEKWPHPGVKKASLGEIYLNRKYAKGDAARALLLHGLLHLLGYDHKKKPDRIRMEKLEKTCLQSM